MGLTLTVARNPCWCAVFVLFVVACNPNPTQRTQQARHRVLVSQLSEAQKALYTRVTATISQVCPNESETPQPAQPIEPRTILRLSEIHEYHDCQKLIAKAADGSLQYGPVVGVFAPRELATSNQSYFEQPEARLVALIENFKKVKYAPI